MSNQETVCYLHFDTSRELDPRWAAILSATKSAARRWLECFVVTLDDESIFSTALAFNKWRKDGDIGVIAADKLSRKGATEALYEALAEITLRTQQRGVLFHCIAMNRLKKGIFSVFRKHTGLPKLLAHDFETLLAADARAAGELPVELYDFKRGAFDDVLPVQRKGTAAYEKALWEFIAPIARSMPAGRFDFPRRNSPFEFLMERDEDFRDAFYYRLHYLIKRHKLDELSQGEREARATLEILSQAARNRYAQEPTYADSFRQRIDAGEPEASSGVSEEFFLAITRSGKNAGFGFSCRVCGLHIPCESPTKINHCGKVFVVDPTAQMRKVQIGSSAIAGAPVAVPLRDDDNETVEYEQADPGGI